MTGDAQDSVRITDGSTYIHDGVISIPECVTEVCDGAFRGMNTSRIELPGTLRVMGRDVSNNQ